LIEIERIARRALFRKDITMTHMSLAELRQLCIDNPDFAAENVGILKTLSKPVLSRTMRELNPDAVPALTRRYDAADTLMDYIRTLAPDLHPLFVRDYPFQRFRIDLANVATKLAIEVDGGQFKPDGATRPLCWPRSDASTSSCDIGRAALSTLHSRASGRIGRSAKATTLLVSST